MMNQGIFFVWGVQGMFKSRSSTSNEGPFAQTLMILQVEAILNRCLSMNSRDVRPSLLRPAVISSRSPDDQKLPIHGDLSSLQDGGHARNLYMPVPTVTRHKRNVTDAIYDEQWRHCRGGQNQTIDPGLQHTFFSYAGRAPYAVLEPDLIDGICVPRTANVPLLRRGV